MGGGGGEGMATHRLSWTKPVTPSAKLYHVWPFPGLLPSFLSLIESEISEQVSQQVATEELNKGL